MIDLFPFVFNYLAPKVYDMGILSSLLISMRLGPANAAIGYDCGVEEELLNNTLAMASTQPDKFAARFMEGTGYMAVMAGDTKHVLHCVSVEVKYRHVDKCFDQLPVERGIDNMYLMPRTYILTKNAREVPCTKPLLEHNKLEGNWYRLTPQPVDTPAPMMLKLSSEITLDYENPADQMKMEKQEDLHSMQKRSYWSLMTIISGLFIGLQSVATAIAKMYSTLKMIEFLFHTVMNAYTLYFKHGRSIRRILADFWISPTDFARGQTENKEARDTIELDSVVLEK